MKIVLPQQPSDKATAMRRAVLDRMCARVADEKATQVEAYLTAILATTDYKPDDYRLVQHTDAEGKTHCWLEHKSVWRGFVVVPPTEEDE